MLRSRRTASAAAVVSAATAIVATAGAAPAHADKSSTQTLRAEYNVGVCESHAGDYSLPFSVSAHDRVVVSAGASIWSGMWGEQRWSPVGKTTSSIFNSMYADNSKYPLPGAPKYGLLLKMDGSYWPTGTSYVRFATSSTSQNVALRINDDVPGNGNGCFSVNVRVYR